MEAVGLRINQKKTKYLPAVANEGDIRWRNMIAKIWEACTNVQDLNTLEQSTKI